jgi:hypothetical protein
MRGFSLEARRLLSSTGHLAKPVAWLRKKSRSLAMFKMFKLYRALFGVLLSMFIPSFQKYALESLSRFLTVPYLGYLILGGLVT